MSKPGCNKVVSYLKETLLLVFLSWGLQVETSVLAWGISFFQHEGYCRLRFVRKRPSFWTQCQILFSRGILWDLKRTRGEKMHLLITWKTPTERNSPPRTWKKPPCPVCCLFQRADLVQKVQLVFEGGRFEWRHKTRLGHYFEHFR